MPHRSDFDSLKGGLKGPVAKAGDPATSELIRRIKGTTQPRVPMTGPPFLSESEIAMFERWVAAGMPRGPGATAGTPAKIAPPRPAPGEAVTYAHVAPIFAARCAKCHADKGVMGPAPEGYRLTSYAATLAIDKAPAAGDYVEVRGRLGEDASVEVDRLRRR